MSFSLFYPWAGEAGNTVGPLRQLNPTEYKGMTSQWHKSLMHLYSFADFEKQKNVQGLLAREESAGLNCCFNSIGFEWIRYVLSWWVEKRKHYG